MGHTDRVRSVAFSPDGDRLVSGDDKALRIWDIHTGEYRQTQETHRNWVWSVTFSPDCKILASSSEDGTIRLWNVETGEIYKILRAPRLYEGMDITGVVNLTKAQINTLITLGATKNDD